MKPDQRLNQSAPHSKKVGNPIGSARRVRRGLSIAALSIASMLSLGVSPSVVGQPQANHLAASTPFLLAQPLPIPEAYVTPINGTVTIQLVNETGAAVGYEVVGETDIRTLDRLSTVTLTQISVPTSITFRRFDNGFLTTTLTPDTPSSGTLIVTLSLGSDLGGDRTAISIDREGGVDVN
ncbi:MAG: hypothetical protein KME20_18450 [Kaiparowitsia implicata GSE-PSE-MK54-09C]|nr:hypothetical protein [Kaiparowitsia implicata GSE-PSE-MK54-09C]